MIIGFQMCMLFFMSLIMPSLWAGRRQLLNADGGEAWKRAITKAFQRLIFTTKGSVTVVS